MNTCQCIRALGKQTINPVVKSTIVNLPVRRLRTPATVPQAGDYSYMWGFFALIPGAALALLVITNRKREENVGSFD